MKMNFKKLTIILAALLIVTGMDAFAQRGRRMISRDYQGVVCPYIPDLTEEQQSRITELRTSHLKEMQEFRNKVDENRVQYRSLVTGDPANRNAINDKIDEFTELKNQMLKKQTNHRQEIRNLLTEEQRVYFDSRRTDRRGPAMRGGGMSRRFGHPSRAPMMRRGW